jgi:gluconolactonase
MSSGWQPAQSYPDPAIVTLDPRFEAIRPPFNAAVERLYTGCRWAEGPVWIGDMRCLLWSDIPNNRNPQMGRGDRCGQCLPQAVELRQRQYRDRQGRLVTCEHGARQVTRTEHDGTITVLCNRFDGSRASSSIRPTMW